MLNNEQASVSDVLKRKLSSLVSEKYDSPVAKLDIAPHPLLETQLLLGGVRLILRENQYHINIFHQEDNGTQLRYIKPRLVVARSHIELLEGDQLRITTSVQSPRKYTKLQESIAYARSAYLPEDIIKPIETNRGQYSVTTKTDLTPEFIDFIDATSSF